MSRYIRGRLERLQGRVGKPASPEDTGPRARVVEYLNHIAARRRSGD